MCRWGGGGARSLKGARREGEIPWDLVSGGGGEIPRDLARGGKITGGEIPGTPRHPKSYQNHNFSPKKLRRFSPSGQVWESPPGASFKHSPLFQRELCDLRRLDRNSKGGEEELEAEKEVCNGRAKLSREQTYNDDYLDNFVDDRRSNTVDRYARIAFPVTYFLYNVCYWAVYLTV